MNLSSIETSQLKQLLRRLATVHTEPGDRYKIDGHYISDALKILNDRPGVTREEMAQFEFWFIQALERSEHGIPNLESQIAQSPELFVRVAALLYKRSDDAEDPSAWRIENPERRAAVALAAHRLLDQLKGIPGRDRGGAIDAAALTAWLTEARRLFHECARDESGDHCIGRLLAKAPVGENGIWPCHAVCEAMERIGAQEIGRGLQFGVRNSRGVHWRGKGGEQERELATKYRDWAERLHFDYPYVGGVLDGIAVSYEREAAWQDSEANINNRLRH